MLLIFLAVTLDILFELLGIYFILLQTLPFKTLLTSLLALKLFLRLHRSLGRIDRIGRSPAGLTRRKTFLICLLAKFLLGDYLLGHRRNGTVRFFH